MEICKPSADLKKISKDANGNLVLSINIPEDNMETDINVIVEQNILATAEISDSESDDDLQEYSRFDLDVKEESTTVIAIKNQIHKYFKYRNEISKRSWNHWHDIPTDSTKRVDLRVICQTCNKIVNRKRALDHAISHMKTYLPFHCPICKGNVQFKNWRLFEKHFIKDHFDFYQENLTKCSKCNKTLFIRKHTCAPVNMPKNKPKKQMVMKTSPTLADFEMFKFPDSKMTVIHNQVEDKKPRLSSTGKDLNQMILETELPDINNPENLVVSYQFDQF